MRFVTVVFRMRALFWLDSRYLMHPTACLPHGTTALRLTGGRSVARVVVGAVPRHRSTIQTPTYSTTVRWVTRLTSGAASGPARLYLERHPTGNGRVEGGSVGRPCHARKQLGQPAGEVE